MQIFRSEEDVDAWLKATANPPGARFPPQQLWELATRWYDDRFELDWQRRSVAERQRILDAIGLTGEFWHVS
jgi:hypothetical protein